MQGSRFGRLVVVAKDSGRYSQVRCDCGSEKRVRNDHLRAGLIQSCGCLSRPDLTGRRFGLLVAVGLAGVGPNGHRLWLTRCDCGGAHTSAGSRLLAGDVKSCGCATKTMIGARRRTHGASVSADPEQRALFRVWSTMKSRCNNPNATEYRNYGARGIRVCERWINDFAAFRADMGQRPTPKHSVDRIEANGDYEPSNCRWATSREQSRNRRNNRRTADGELVIDKAASLGVNYFTALDRVKRGVSITG